MGGAVAALSAEAALAGSAIAGTSAVAFKEGANYLDELVSRLNLQMNDLEGQRSKVKEAEGSCQDLLKQITLASRDYGDAEDAFSELDLEDLVSFAGQAKKRLTNLLDDTSPSDAGLAILDATAP